jgi:hypothetical protein
MPTHSAAPHHTTPLPWPHICPHTTPFGPTQAPTQLKPYSGGTPTQWNQTTEPDVLAYPLSYRSPFILPQGFVHHTIPLVPHPPRHHSGWNHRGPKPMVTPLNRTQVLHPISTSADSGANTRGRANTNPGTTHNLTWPTSKPRSPTAASEATQNTRATTPFTGSDPGLPD